MEIMREVGDFGEGLGFRPKIYSAFRSILRQLSFLEIGRTDLRAANSQTHVKNLLRKKPKSTQQETGKKDRNTMLFDCVETLLAL